MRLILLFLAVLLIMPEVFAQNENKGNTNTVKIYSVQEADSKYTFDDDTLSGKVVKLKKGTEFVKVELTPTKKVKLYKLSENSVKPFKTLLQHSLNEDMFPNPYPLSPVTWNDGRIDGPFEPTSSINGVLLNSISCLTKIKEELMNLSVEQVTVLLQGLGNTFEEQVIREVIFKYMEMAGHPMRFGLANGV